MLTGLEIVEAVQEHFRVVPISWIGAKATFVDDKYPMVESLG